MVDDRLPSREERGSAGRPASRPPRRRRGADVLLTEAPDTGGVPPATAASDGVLDVLPARGSWSVGIWGPAVCQAARVPRPPEPEPEDVLARPLRVQLEAFLDEHRAMLLACLEGLSEEQARRSLVPSRTTLLGLVKHAAFVEAVWFDESVTGRSRAEIGIADGPDASFVLSDGDTVATVRQAFTEACASSRRAVAPLGLDDLVHGNRRGPLPLRWVLLHVLREHAQHCGHADVLREQVLSDL